MKARAHKPDTDVSSHLEAETELHSQEEKQQNGFTEFCFSADFSLSQTLPPLARDMVTPRAVELGPHRAGSGLRRPLPAEKAEQRRTVAALETSAVEMDEARAWPSKAHLTEVISGMLLLG